MGINLTKKNFLIAATLSMAIGGVLVGAFIRFVLPSHYFAWYPVIPIFFYVFEWFYIYMFDACRKYRPENILSVYMSMKAIKMIVSMFILVFYVMYAKVHREDFILTFFLFYLISLTFESIFFYLYEANRKKKKQLEK